MHIRQRHRHQLHPLVLALSVAAMAVPLPLTAPARALAAAPASRFVPVVPTRLLDTRSSRGGRPLSAGETIQLAVGGMASIPPTAIAVAANITVTESAAAGYVTAWPSGVAQPTVSNVNVTGMGQTIANFSIIPLGADGDIQLFTQSGGHLIVDVSGYWEATESSRSGRYIAIEPSRIVDTRAGLGASPGKVGASDRRSIDVALPTTLDGASAVAVNVTAVGAAGPGFVAAFPTGVPLPLASNVNVRGGDIVPNLALVPVSADGHFTLYASTALDLVVDVQGYVTSDRDVDSDEGLFVPLTPTRVADSRGPGALLRLGAMFDQELTVGGLAGVPTAGVSAVAINVTATTPWGDGYLAVYPGQTPRPLVSNLNYDAGDTVAGFALPRVGQDGTINLVSQRQADAIVDVAGYFVGTAAAAAAPPPVKCADLMGYLHDPDGYVQAGETVQLEMADLSGRRDDWPLDSATTFFKIAPGCQYALMARPSTAFPGSLGIYRIDGLTERTEPVLVSDGWPWRGTAFTPDARWAFLWAGPYTDGGIAGPIIAVNMLTGEERFATEARLNEIIGVTASGHVVVNQDPEYPDVAICEFGAFGYGKSGGDGREPCHRGIGIGGISGEYSDVPDAAFGTTPRAVAIGERGWAGWRGELGNNAVQLIDSDAYYGRLTWDDFAVVSVAGRGVLLFDYSQLDPFATYHTGTPILNGIDDDYPEFSRPLRASREPPMVVDPCAFFSPGC